MEAELLKWEQIDCELTHRFAPGVYLRELKMPARARIIGQLHRTEHFNIVLSGRAHVYMDGTTYDIVGPCTFVSKPGVRKLLHVLEEMVWQTVHPTDETNLAKLEELLIEKSDAFRTYEAEMVALDFDRSSFFSVVRELGFDPHTIRSISEYAEDQIPMPPEWTGRVAVKRSEIEGLGLFSAVDFKAGDVIAPARVGAFRTTAGRFTNHSLRANAAMAESRFGGIDLVATADIAVDKEITIDYRQAAEINRAASKQLSEGSLCLG